MDADRIKRMERARLPERKRRRLTLKEERATSKGGNEAMEGLSYQSEIGLSVNDKEDIESIPEPVPKPSFCSSTKLKHCPSPNVVILDLETTGLIQHGIVPHITQIAAVNRNTKEQFSRYVAPDLPITPMAEKVTNITWSGGVLCYRGEPVDFVRVKSALEDFLEWLEKFPSIVMVAHNGRTFDFRVLCRAFHRCGLQERFCSNVAAFCDSLTLFRQKYPKLDKYKQEFLAQHFCGHTYNAHNAVDDVVMLDEIIEAGLISVSDFKKHSYDTDCQFLQEEFNSCKSKNVASLRPLIGEKVMKSCTVENIAGSGLNLGHLRLIFKRSGEDGLVNVFSMKNSLGKPRVTSDKKVLGECIPKLCAYFSK
ncbi:uncharacterized protein LOC134258289 [Saccostrea cucullata]|uniref:uncharacterized protein LOC134258289 n=1 Tax=Saccostrea cuccullata TaxID=36930 RepID=UPI002ED26BAE